jgi:uncharacterized protein YndB with AHSA1/START domain
VTVTNAQRDHEKLTLTITGEFEASLEQVWKLWEDPRQLERWWGPPTYPATFVEYNFSPGGRVSYFMTGPEGDQSHGWWRILEIDAQRGLTFENGIADETGNPDASIPFIIVRASLIEVSIGETRLEVESTYPSVAAMEKFLDMQMEEGMVGAISQIDGLLAGDSPH